MTTQTPDAVREAITLITEAKTTLGAFAIASAPKPLPQNANTAIWKLARALEILAALDSRAGDAGEESEALTGPQLDSVLDAINFALAGEADREAFPHGAAVMERAYSKLSGLKGRTVRAAATPAPAVDAVPAGEVRKMVETLRGEMAAAPKRDWYPVHRDYLDAILSASLSHGEGR